MSLFLFEFNLIIFESNINSKLEIELKSMFISEFLLELGSVFNLEKFELIFYF